MSRQYRASLAWLLIGLTVFTGCHPTQPYYVHSDGDLSHFLDKATEAEHSDVDNPRLAEVDNALAPLTLSNPEFNEIWDLKLEECVSIALQNSKVIRNAGAIQANFGFSDALIERVQGFATPYDTAITESASPGSTRNGATTGTSSPLGVGPARANQVGGVEAALSDFDAQFFATFNYGKDDRPQNTTGNFFQTSNFRGAGTQSGGGPSGAIAGINKKTATGGRFWLREQTDFNWNNQPLNAGGRALAGDWTQTVEIEWDQPLGRGRGVMINRIPVVLARINTDISIANFEGAVRNLLMDLENAYWDLHFAYRNLEATKVGRDSAQVTWKIVYEKWSKGVSPVQEEAQARGQYFQFRAGAEQALSEVYNSETRLRWLMGLAATDGRLIRPQDEPTTARVDFNWNQIHSESLFRSPELRQQKWAIKQRELELISSRNQLLPDIDVYAVYRWLGKGDEWMNADRNGINYPNRGSTAVDNLTEGQYTESFFGLRFTPPKFGARSELAGVRNAQLQLARAKAQLEEMELNQSHLLTAAIRQLDTNFEVAQTQFNRWAAAEKEVESSMALYTGGKQTLDIVLDAQRRKAQAQTDYYRSITEYNKSLAFVHYRKGSLGELNGVALAEGPWPDKAYWDALGHARQRDASYYLNYGWSRPKVVSRGPVQQGIGDAETMAEEIFDSIPTPAAEPTPADRPEEISPPVPEALEMEMEKPTAPKALGPTTRVPSLSAPANALRVRAADVQPATAEEPVAAEPAEEKLAPIANSLRTTTKVNRRPVTSVR